MLNPKLNEYVESVLDMGFSHSEIIDAMVKRGYNKKDAKNIIKEILRTRKTKGLFEKKLIDMGHDEFLKKIDKKTVNYIKKEFEMGHRPEQIVSVLKEEGYNKKTLQKTVEIVAGRHKKHKLFSKLSDEVRHLKDIEYHFVADRKWIRDLGILSAVLIVVSIAIYYKNSGLASLILKAVSFLMVIPLLALFFYRLSAKYRERTYKDALTQVSIIGLGVFIIDLIAPFYAVLIALPVLFLLFMHLVENNYEIERKQALKLSALSFLTGAVAIYLILTIIGVITGIVGVIAL